MGDEKMDEAERVTHYSRCFGCGEANESGLRLEAHLEGLELVAYHTPPPDSEGGPGIVHGGYIGALVDEVMSLFASARSEIPAMTRRIEIDYKLPTLTNHPLELRAGLEEETERKMIVWVTGRSRDGEHPSFLAKGILVKVQVKDWSRQMATQGVDVNQIDFQSGDPSNYHRWVIESMKAAFEQPRVMDRISIALELSDVEPSGWTLTVDSDGFSVLEEVLDSDHDVKLEGQFGSWLELVTRKKDLSTLKQEGELKVTGDPEAFARFRNCFNFRPLNAPRAEVES